MKHISKRSIEYITSVILFTQLLGMMLSFSAIKDERQSNIFKNNKKEKKLMILGLFSLITFYLLFFRSVNSKSVSFKLTSLYFFALSFASLVYNKEYVVINVLLSMIYVFITYERNVSFP